jgi:hypothetical protein
MILANFEASHDTLLDSHQTEPRTKIVLIETLFDRRIDGG